jgi:tRNA A-37 threonylcarbamoyl transferase component Bud32
MSIDHNDVIKKSFAELLICKRAYFTPAMQQFLANPNIALAKSNGPFFKNKVDDTTTVGVVTVDNFKLVVKRYNVKNIWHSLKKCLRQSRALRSWSNSHYLLSNGILTPQPVAIVIKRFGCWRKETYFITEYLEGIRGSDFFERTNQSQTVWENAVQKVKALLKQMEQALITHDDFQHRNMIVCNDIIALLDLDHMRIHKHKGWWFKLNYRKDIEHFVRLLGVNPEAQRIFAGATVTAFGEVNMHHIVRQH